MEEAGTRAVRTVRLALRLARRHGLEALVASGAATLRLAAPSSCGASFAPPFTDSAGDGGESSSWRSRRATSEIPTGGADGPGSGCSPTRLTSLSVGLHPLELLRPHLPGEVLSSADLEEAPPGARVAVAGLAVARQRPATASGVVFMLIEDEHGQMNLIIPPPVYDRYRALVRGEPRCSRAGASSA